MSGLRSSHEESYNQQSQGMSKQKIKGIFPPVDRRFIWIGLGLLTLLLRPVFSINPHFTEVVYSRGLFAILRNVWDYTLGWSPVPLLYIAIPLLLWLGARFVIKSIRKPRGRSLANRIAGMTLNLLAFAGAVIFLFFFLWGFNYYRTAVDQRLELHAGKLDEAVIREEFARATEELLNARKAWVPDAQHSPANPFSHTQLESQLRASLVQVLKNHQYSAPGRVRARRLRPKGLLMQLGAVGIYIPFVFEGHVDAATHPLTHPFTLSHEMAHGYGFGDEGTCSFWAYLACIHAEDPAIRYGGILGYWREAAVLYRMIDRESYQQQRENLPIGIQADLDAINEALRKYPGFFPEFSDEVYDSYLKNQGIEEGTGSYGQVVKWVSAWQKKYGSN